MVAMLFGSLSATETLHSRIRLTKTPHPHQPPTSRPALTKTQPQPQHLNQFSPFVLRRAVRGSARVQPPPVTDPAQSAPAPSQKPQAPGTAITSWSPVSARTRALSRTVRLKQNPESFFSYWSYSCFPSAPAARALPHPAHKNKKTSRPSSLRGEKKPQISATTHQRTEISTRNFFQNFPQLLSEQRHLCVNNPGVVERERSQTGLPGQQPPPRATCPDPRRPGPVETVQPTR